LLRDRSSFPASPPIALRQARKQIPKDQQRLKERLESSAV